MLYRVLVDNAGEPARRARPPRSDRWLLPILAAGFLLLGVVLMLLG